MTSPMLRTMAARLRAGAAGSASLLALLSVIALAGGSSRADSLGQFIVRSASVLAIAVSLVASRSSDWRRLRIAFVFLGLVALVMVLQLIPLPPRVWAALPGHGLYAGSSAAAGIAPGWRPLALSPDRAFSALFALLVPLAVLIGLARLSSAQRAGLMLPLLIVVFVSAVLGLAQLSGGEASPLRWYASSSDRSATGLLANRNHQALLLAMALPVLAGLACVPGLRREQRRVRGYAALGCGAFLILMLPTTGSRAGIVLGTMGAVLALAIAAPTLRAGLRAQRRRRRRMVIGGTVVGAAVFGAVLVLFGRNEAFHRLATLDATEDLRARTLPVVIEMTETYFPVGIGFGGFDPVFRYFEPFDQLKFTYFNQAHDDLLQVVLEGGLAAAALLAAFAIWWAAASLRAWRSPPSPQAMAARAGSGIVVMTLVASAVDYPVRTPLILAILTIAAAWMITPAGRRERRDGTGD